jgi:hypothetical protein
MPNPQPSRNLVIVQTVPQQDPADWTSIKQQIEREAPDIEVRIANNLYRKSVLEVGDAGFANHRNRNSVIASWQVQRPSLVFSPIRLIDYVPRGGAIYCGRVIGKDEQLRRLSSIGVLTPKTATLTPAGTFDPGEWGGYVVVKPNNMNSGDGIRLVRTLDLPTRYAELTAGFNDEFLVQPYIDSGDGYPTAYRILSMFGRAVYCTRNGWSKARAPLAEIAADPSGVIASNNDTVGGQIHTICNDAEIILLGERAHEAFPECPVLGVDIIRESQSGRLYVLEVNPHGVVWHLSSEFIKNLDPEYVRERYTQFNALDLAADLLIQKTRAEAC